MSKMDTVATGKCCVDEAQALEILLKMEYLSSIDFHGEASRVSDGLGASTFVDNS